MTGILNKALSCPLLVDYARQLLNKNLNEVGTALYRTHLLENYTFELAKDCHGYYNGHKIVDA